MASSKRSLLVGGIGAFLLCAGVGARAQNTAAPAETAPPAAIGNPQLRNFSLTPTETIVTQPATPPQAQPPVELPPPPTATSPRTTTPTTQSATRAPSPTGPARQAAPAGPAMQDAPATGSAPTDLAAPGFGHPASGAPSDISEAMPVGPAAEDTGSTPYWYYAIPALALALLGLVVVRRRRRNGELEPVAEPAPLVAEPPRPRPDPIPRPWLELSLKAERASFTATEAVVQFELEISNTGGSAARNLRIDVKMFNAGAEQDQEIGAFFRTAGRESTKLSLPTVEAGVTGVIKGQVKMSVDEMRAVRLDERLLFIPVIAVNALYDRGADRTGQTSLSYVIGRELQQPSEKMGAFRVDQGPRVWRTIGQRAHSLAKRV